MGLRATSVKTYKIEYGDHCGFNYDPYTLSNIIGSFCDDFYNGNDGCGGLSTDAIWEVDKEQFAEMLDKIKEMDPEEYKTFIYECDAPILGYERTYTKEDVVKLFEGYLKDTQENSSYVRIAWL